LVFVKRLFGFYYLEYTTVWCGGTNFEGFANLFGFGRISVSGQDFIKMQGPVLVNRSLKSHVFVMALPAFGVNEALRRAQDKLREVKNP